MPSLNFYFVNPADGGILLWHTQAEFKNSQTLSKPQDFLLSCARSTLGALEEVKQKMPALEKSLFGLLPLSAKLSVLFMCFLSAFQSSPAVTCGPAC